MNFIKNYLANLLTVQTRNILLATLFIMVTGNLAFFKRLSILYPLGSNNTGLLVSLTLFFTISSAIFLLIVCQSKATRWLLAFFLITASQAAYYMDTFGVIIDPVMLDNIFHTDKKEVWGLISASLILRTVFLGVLPAWLAIKYTPSICNASAEFKARVKLIGWLFLAIVIIVAPFTAGYATFIREHRVTRFYANPTYFSASVIKYVTQKLSSTPSTILQKTATDAVNLDKQGRHELMIMVVGETARADRFSLNGYHRETNPELKKQDVISFSHVSSCGTSTGVSVPCMFSELSRKEYDKDKGLAMENALDVLAHNGIEVLWRDNNSDSKGVATRIKYEDFISPTLNPVCEGECRDIGMLSGLDKYIAARKDKDILIVLHQMGNHGPEYYRRYPKEFERFKPMCMSGELQNCTKEEVDNSYDNAILYTDYFLSQVIEFLKKYDGTRETAMLYVSDHGESLGENGFYLHAMPYAIAPKEQTHVPAILWLGKNFDYKMEQVMPYKDTALSHDDVFCSLLVGFELYSKTCESKKEMLMQNLDLKAEAEIKSSASNG
jgi:lipid A ethanolaminephosphotransferase